MKPERALIAERPLAQHCAQLLRAGPAPADLLPQLDRAGQALARALAPALAGLAGGEVPAVTPRAAAQTTMAALLSAHGELAANTLFSAGAQGLPLLVAVEGPAVLRLVDRAFGGKGEAPALLPEAFPLSAELMVARIEGLLAAALAEALGDAVTPQRRGEQLAELAPFAADTALAVLECEVMEGVRSPWTLTLALPLAALPRLFAAPAHRPTRTPRAADPAAAPFADLPLPLSAVLVDMAVPLSAIGALAPGMVLPVAVARAVPLRIGPRTIARGTMGEADDRVALKLTEGPNHP